MSCVSRGETQLGENREKEVTRKRFSDVETSTLDGIHITSGGKPSKATIETTAKFLKLEKRPVS